MTEGLWYIPPEVKKDDNRGRAEHPKRGFLRRIRSVKTAVILIAVIIGLTIISTFIPQNRELAFYYREYPDWLASVITALQFHTFFRSILFLSLGGLFAVNLFACTLYRIISRVKEKASVRIGPDLIHISLLVLLLGGGITWLTRREAYVRLWEGDGMELPNGVRIVVTDLEALTYSDGRPRDWLTAVEVHEGENPPAEVTIEVNKPLRLSDYTVYQESFGTGETGDEYTTGLRIVDDPGYTPVFAALILLCIGLLLTFIQKRKKG